MSQADGTADAGPVDARPTSAASATHPSQSTRYLAWLYSPPLQRPVLAALCAIESEVAGSLRAGLDHHVAHTRLQWWGEECERAAQGRPVHPMTRELVRAGTSPPIRTIHPPLAETTLPALVGIRGFVDTAVWDLAGATFENRRELAAYCERWAAAMIEPFATYAARVTEPTRPTAAAARASASEVSPASGTPNAPATSRWRALGAALREIELLAALAHEAHAGRLRIPLDELERSGVDPTSVGKQPWPAALVTLLRERHESLRASLAQGVAGLDREEQSNFRGLLVWAALASQLSWRAQRALPNALVPSRYHALADGWRAWRAARQAITGHFRLQSDRTDRMEQH